MKPVAGLKMDLALICSTVLLLSSGRRSTLLVCTDNQFGFFSFSRSPDLGVEQSVLAKRATLLDNTEHSLANALIRNGDVHP
jgi:hypothetical protein